MEERERRAILSGMNRRQTELLCRVAGDTVAAVTMSGG